MEQGLIVRENKDHLECVKTLIVDNPEKLSILNNPIRREIITLLAKKPLYPIEIAKVLGLHEQKVYYHVKQLLNLKIIKEVERKEIRGTIAKRYQPVLCNFSVILGKTWEKYEGKAELDKMTHYEEALYPFIEQGDINCSVVVGSPDPHGTYKAYARDGHYAVELSLFMGKIAKKSLSEKFSVILDVDVKSERKEDENLIVIGGPITNTIVNEINDKLPISFTEGPWGLYSKKTRKTYTGDSIGVIQAINSPYNADKKILVIAGIREKGTKSAIMGLTKDLSVLNRVKRANSCIVEGFDMDGDGRLDSIEILE